MSSCGICQKETTVSSTDCDFLYFLEKIKIHYLVSQKKLKEKDVEITELKKTNNHLSNTIKDLKSRENYSITPEDRKRRKTNSIDSSSDLDASKLFPKIDILANLNNNDSIDTSNTEIISENENVSLNADDDVFFAPTQIITPTKKISPRPANKVLSPINNNLNEIRNNFESLKTTESVSCSPLLPRMAKNKVNKTNSENERPANWKSKDRIKNTGKKINENSWRGLSFIQPGRPPVKEEHSKKIVEILDSSNEMIASSQDVNKQQRNILSLARVNRMKQSRLQFDRNIKPIRQRSENDETFLGEVVEASPVQIAPTKTLRSLRKITRKKSDDEIFAFHSTKKQTSIATAGEEQQESRRKNENTITSTPKSSSIPTSLKDMKKDHIKKELHKPNDLFDGKKTESIINHVLGKNSTTFLEPNHDSNREKTNKTEDSSCCILPSQKDDVICVDDTENINFDDIDSADLFNEIMRQQDHTNPILKHIEGNQLRTNQKSQNKSPRKLKISNPPLKKDPEFVMKSENECDLDATQLDSFEQQLLVDNKSKNTNFSDNKTNQNFNKDNIQNFKESNNKGSVVHHECESCEKYKKFLMRLGKSNEEIAQSLKNCKLHKPLKLHLTPENFWDPRFLSYPEDDIRNETLIDYRFVKGDTKDKDNPSDENK